MKRILFSCFCLFPFLVARSYGAIEVIIDGHKYDSLQDYAQAKKNALLQSTVAPVALDKNQEDDIRKAVQKLGIRVDFNQMKTFQINQEGLSDASRHKLYVLSVEKGVVGALQDFYKTVGQADFPMNHRISTDQLQEVIAQAVGKSKYPKLLISSPGKMRIMALTASESDE
jgi:hypothetical protein